MKTVKREDIVALTELRLAHSIIAKTFLTRTGHIKQRNEAALLIAGLIESLYEKTGTK